VTQRVLLVADTGGESGLGHLSRSTAVAVALGVRGLHCMCLANGAAEPIERDGVRWLPIDQRDVLPPGDDYAAIVLDSYRIEDADPRGALLTVLQESTDPPAHASLVVNVSADPAGGDQRRLYGPAYACLRPSFWGLPLAAPSEHVERVLVTTGAGDPGGAASVVADAVRTALPTSHVVVVEGPFASAASMQGVEIVRAPQSLLPHLLDADLVVTAGGQTMLEATAAGTPTVALPLVANQAAHVDRLARLGAVEAADLESLPQVVARLAGDPAGRARLAQRAQATVDGYGALRVAFAIARIIPPA
jgi:UDP-2,4-diacetamido-2,4,6-trideoxy-beta-L-altropyranose hydrolase